MRKREKYNIILRIILSFVLLLLLGGLVASIAEEEEESQRVLKKRIAVAGFENKVRPWWGWHWEIGEGMADMLVTALVKTGKFTVLERQALQDVLKEQKLGESGRVSTQTAAQAGKLLGAQILIRGAVTEFSHKESGGAGRIKIKGFSIGISEQRAHVGIDLRMYDTSTAEIKFSDNVEGKAESRSLSVGTTYKGVAIGASSFKKTPLGKATREVIDRAVEIIVERMGKIPWQGSVITVKNGEVYINAGLNDNVEEGDAFVVYEKGEEFIDPETGISLGVEETQLGEIKVISVKEKYSIAEALEGSNFSRGNIIREAL
ncbi:hypothetical protein HQ584_00325 [Patescibacteria group bacterium]|nr:hypothetical protein [Patescibacteria group bacterium]